MIHIIAGGKKHLDWVNIAVSEYQKRLKKPFNIEWELIEEEIESISCEMAIFGTAVCDSAG